MNGSRAHEDAPRSGEHPPAAASSPERTSPAGAHRGRRRKKGGPPNRGVPGHPEHRTGDPVIAPGGQPAAVTAVAALALAGAAQLGRPLVALVVVLLQAVTAAGFYRLNGMWPARQGIALAFLAGLSANAALLVASERNAASAAVGVLGIWILLVLLLQLRNHGGPDERLYALTVAVGATVLTVLAAAHLAAFSVSADAVTVGGVAVAVAVCVRALPLSGSLTLLAALLVAAGSGAVTGAWADLGTGAGALLGLAAGGGALVGLRAASYDWPSRFVHLTAGVALPLALAGPVVYLLGRAVG